MNFDKKFRIGDLVSDGYDTYGIVIRIDPTHEKRIHTTTRYLVTWVNAINHNEQWMFGVDLELEKRA